MSVYYYNVRYNQMGKGMIRKFWWFSSNEFWDNIGCIIMDPTFGIGWKIL